MNWYQKLSKVLPVAAPSRGNDNSDDEAIIHVSRTIRFEGRKTSASIAAGPRKPVLKPPPHTPPIALRPTTAVPPVKPKPKVLPGGYRRWRPPHTV